ncbi:hypothetical protein BT69DRAFT_1339151 [Atractiella rhizophila]|nr:hypothetical protein BT69DRAFT_1339151 [Atractiella rhizophila]
MSHIEAGKSSPNRDSYVDEKKDEESYDYDAKAQVIQVSEAPEGHQLHRALTARQIQMIALGGAIGTGLLIGTGGAISRAGPASVFISYVWMGGVCFSVLSSLAEICCAIPVQDGFTGYAMRLWNYLIKYLIVTPNNLTAASLVVRWWTDAVPVAAWISIFIVIIVLINLWGVKYFGILEFWFSLSKVVGIVVILITAIVVDLGGNPHHDRLGFRNWQIEGAPFHNYKQPGALGRFLGFWSSFSTALFAYIGSELLGVCIGESRNPRKTMSSAIKRTFWRGSLLIGMLVPYNSTELIGATKQSTGAAASPFTVAFTLVGLRSVSHFINVVLMICTLSAANSDLYIATRTLYSLSVDGKAPRFFSKTDKRGVPLASVVAASLFCALAYLNVSTNGSEVFGYFSSMVTSFGGLMWAAISFMHLRFVKACKLQGIDRNSLPYKAPLGVTGSYISLFFILLLLITRGFDTFMPFNHKTFITTYLGIVIMPIFYTGYKLYYKTKVVDLSELDFQFSANAEKDKYWAEIEAREEAEKGPPNLLTKIWRTLA